MYQQKRVPKVSRKGLAFKTEVIRKHFSELRVVHDRNTGLLSSPWADGHYRQPTYKTEHWALAFWNILQPFFIDKHFSLKSKLHKIKEQNIKCLALSVVLVGFSTFRGYWCKYLQKDTSTETLRTSLRRTKFHNKRCFTWRYHMKTVSQL